MKAIILLCYFIAVIALVSCQKKNDSEKIQDTSGEVTPTVLSKVSNQHAYLSHGSSIFLNSDGSYALRFNGRVHSFVADTPDSQDEARCVVSLKGRVKFFKSPRITNSVAVYTTVQMSVEDAWAVDMANTPNSSTNADLHSICDSYSKAMMKKQNFVNFVVAYDGLAISFAGMQFNIEKPKNNLENKTKDEFQFTCSQYLEDSTAEYDVASMRGQELFFLLPGQEINLTDLFVKDLRDAMTQDLDDKSQDRENLTPITLSVDGYEGSTMPVSIEQAECKLSYKYYILSVKATSDGVVLKMNGNSTQPGTDSPACVKLKETLDAFAGNSTISYTTKNSPMAHGSTKISFYLTRADREKVTLRFKSN